MNNVLVSLIIPIYNAEKFLMKCIDSVLKQTYNNIEVILVNDGSSDKSGLICEKIKEQDSRVKVIHQENLGPSAARNNGVLKSKGDYLQFVDADDHIESTMVEELLFACESETDLVICGYYLNETETKQVIPNNQGIYRLSEFMGFFPELFKKLLINSPGNKLYTANIIKGNKLEFPLNVNKGEDLMFNIKYLQHCEKISLIKRPLYHNNILMNPLSLTKIYVENYFENRKKTFNDFNNFLSEYTHQYPSIKKLLEETYTTSIITSMANIYQPQNQLSKNEQKKQLREIVEDNWVRENIKQIERGKKSGIIMRFLVKHKLLSGISLYFKMRLIIKKVIN